jgi:WD40 repeat protein
MDQFGRLRTFDASGRLLGETNTGFSWLGAVSGDDATGKLAFGGSSGALIVDPATGEVDPIPNSANVTSVGFARDGELLVIVGDDGSVRLWDVEQQISAGLICKGSGGASASPPWYDESTDSLWVATSGQVLRFPLDPQRWVDRACEIVGRDFTQAEWDRFVPGGEPLQSSCL